MDSAFPVDTDHLSDLSSNWRGRICWRYRSSGKDCTGANRPQSFVVGTAHESGFANGSACGHHERDYCRNSGDQDVCMGDTIPKGGR